MIFLNAIVLIFEILYYSLFMKFARKDGKLWRYLLLFSLINIFFFFVSTSKLYSYLFLILLMLYGLKYIVKLKVNLYEMMTLTIMLLTKLVIEFIFMIISYKILKFNPFISTLIFSSAKIILIIIFRNKINFYNYKLKNLWNNNNFYVRYFFTTGIYLYVILSIISILWLII